MIAAGQRDGARAGNGVGQIVRAPGQRIARAGDNQRRRSDGCERIVA